MATADYEMTKYKWLNKGEKVYNSSYLLRCTDDELGAIKARTHILSLNAHTIHFFK